MRSIETNNADIASLLEAIRLEYGYDFCGYAKTFVKRRIRRLLAASGLVSISQMQHRVLTDTAFLESLLLDLSINTTEMFRNPSFFRALREHVLPIYADRPTLTIWHAGCATGEEVYSMAIILREMGLTDKSRIYATDFNEVVLAKAREGIFSVDRIKGYTVNYQKAGGRGSFADYYTAGYGSAMISPSLRKNVVFSDHNLVTDGLFAEVDLVVCRNVLIYFSRELQSRVLKQFCDGLHPGGFLCVGSKETPRFSECANQLVRFAPRQSIYRKKPASDDLSAAARPIGLFGIKAPASRATVSVAAGVNNG